jgi:hypothetical protein
MRVIIKSSEENGTLSLVMFSRSCGRTESTNRGFVPLIRCERLAVIDLSTQRARVGLISPPYMTSTHDSKEHQNRV